MAARSFHELVEQAYVARHEFGIKGKQAAISRIAILTGLTRKEVQTLLDMPSDREDPYGDEYNRAARVITGWLRDPDFGDGNGHPVSLRMAGKRLSFSALVKRCSGDIPIRAMLDELLRVGAVKRIKDGRTGSSFGATSRKKVWINAWRFWVRMQPTVSPQLITTCSGTPPGRVSNEK